MNAATMTFGVEFEVTIPGSTLTEQGIRVGSYYSGIQVPGLPEGWKAKSDTSITADAGHIGMEIVSPVLSGPEGLAQVRQVCDTLTAWGCKVNRSTGMHVHVGFEGQDAPALARLICLTAHYENALFAVTGTPHRKDNYFCKSFKNHGTIREVAKDGKLAGKRFTHSDRYHALNLMNLAEATRPTVEFRVFAGTTSGVKAAAYVQLCIGLVMTAMTTKVRCSWDAKESTAKALEGKGTGYKAVHNLLSIFKWTGKRDGWGWMESTALRAESVKELFRLADKFDSRAV